MMTTETELRSLDIFCAETVMGFREHDRAEGVWYGPDNSFFGFHPTTNAADAMSVLDNCREKVKNQSDSEHRFSVRIDCDFPFRIYRLEEKFMECRFGVEAETLPLAIAKFARALFSR